MKYLKEPFSQGDLDSLCGLYSLVNIAHYLIGPFNEEEGQDMICHMLDLLDEREGAVTVFNEGIEIKTMSYLIRNVLRKEYGIKYQKLFKKGKYRGRGGRINEMAKKINIEENIALISLDGRYTHWSAVYRVSRRRLFCYDSNQMQWINLIDTSLTRKGRKIHKIVKNECYLFYLK